MCSDTIPATSPGSLWLGWPGGAANRARMHRDHWPLASGFPAKPSRAGVFQRLLGRTDDHQNTRLLFPPVQTLDFLCFAKPKQRLNQGEQAVCACHFLAPLFASEWKHCLSKESDTCCQNNAMAAKCPQSHLEQFCFLLLLSML